MELGIGSNKSASEKKSGNRDYPQEINHIYFVQDFSTTYDGTEVTELWKPSYCQEKPDKIVEANYFSKRLS